MARKPVDSPPAAEGLVSSVFSLSKAKQAPIHSKHKRARPMALKNTNKLSNASVLRSPCKKKLAAVVLLGFVKFPPYTLPPKETLQNYKFSLRPI